jgi:hypothetical protein
MMHTLAALVAERVSPHEVLVDQWSPLVEAATRQGLGPMLLHTLRQGDALTLLPTDALARLRSDGAQTAATNSLAQATATEWSRRFAEASIPAIWIKGVALELTVYPHPGLRPMTDIDLLVSPEDVDRAVRAVETHTGNKGVHLPQGIDRHAVVYAGPNGLVRMELHWSLVDLPGLGMAEDTAWFLSQWEVRRTGEAELLVLRPEAHLLYLCAHAEILHGEADFRLLRYFDLHRLVTCSDQIQWATLVAQAASCGWTYATERALSIAQQYFSTPLPDELLGELRSRRTAAEDISRVTRHQAATERGQKLLNRFADQPWPARVRLALGLAFPSAAYMRHRYQLDAGWKVPFYYPYRWFDTGQAVFHTLARRRPQGPGQDG